MRNATLLFFIFVLSSSLSCGKKARSIDKMASARDINGLSDVISAGSETTDRRVAAAHALIQLDLANRVMGSIEKLGPQDPEASKALVARLSTELVAQLTDDSNKSIMARDALITLVPRMTPETTKTVADGVLKWTVADMEKRADCGNFKLLKILEELGPAATDEALAELSKKHTAWMLADFKSRGEDGAMVWKRANPEEADIKVSVHKDTYRRYWKYFRKDVLDGVVAAYDVTAPSDRQVQDIMIIVDYAVGDERPKAGAVLLEQMKSKQKTTPMSVRALGELGTVGAVDYLRNWMRPDIPDDLRDAAFEAVTVMQKDPAATAALYQISKPLLEAMLRKDLPEKNQLKLSRTAVESLKFPRTCELPESEYKLVRDVFKMKMDGALFDFRKNMMIPLQRLMLCTGKGAALRELQDSLRFPMKPEEFFNVVAVLDSLPMADLRPLLRKDLSSKKPELAALAVMGLGAFGEKEDLTLLEGMKTSSMPLPEWNKTLGELASEAITLLKTKFPTTN